MASTSAVSPGLGPVVAGDAWLGRRVLRPIDLERDSTNRQNIARLQGLLAEHPFSVDEGSIGTAEVPDEQLAIVQVQLAVTATDLRGADSDQAIIVPPDAVDSIHQLKRVCLATSADNLKYVVHMEAIPAGWLV